MIVIDEKILRLPCEKATPEEAKDIIQKLELELKKSAERGKPGVGLAAPQINIHKSVAIIRCPMPNGEMVKLNLVNAEIENQYDDITFDGEGCLSLPGKSLKTKRFNEVIVKNDGYPQRFQLSGFIAIVAQHEIDHYNGILMVDRIVNE